MIKVAHDKKVTISVGQNKNSKKWRNKTLLWSELLQRLSETHRTFETEKEYANLTKGERDRIKDIGGFVGGNITGGRRKKGAVTFRSLITLDIDYANKDFDVWEVFTMLYGVAACIYSTHSHRENTPRLRIVLPLDREIDPEEYQPIARKIAGYLDIEIFDNTTFQPERLMFWPSTPADGEYIFKYQDGPILKADKILNEYYDWKDASQWPVSEKAIEAVARGVKKQGDPTEKPGIVGAFNRSYSIEEAINEYLSEVYEKTDIKDRFTYLQGSTAAGLIVYNDVFAYSHHGTDPISEKLCSAFDLVRIHLFGEQDAEIDEKTPINKRPSFIAMRELALKSKTVRKSLVENRIEQANEAFKEFAMLPDMAEDTRGQECEETTEDQAGNDWLEELEVDKQGVIKSTIDNVVRILENDVRLVGVIAVDEFANNLVKRKAFRWAKGNSYLFSDTDEAHIRRYLEKKYGVTGQGKIRDAIDIVGAQNIFHPVRDYLHSLNWDGVERLDHILTRYMGAEDSEYTRAVIRKTLVAAVSRVMEPGCKMDYMLHLHGPQGIKKSSFFAALGGKWYNKNFTFSMIGKKDAIEQLQGSWINEIGELDGLNKAETNSVKNFIDIPRDDMRPAYGRFKVQYERQGIFVGTGNDDMPLRDQTGGRRFWPVRVTGAKHWHEFKQLIPQIWAEAYALYLAGEPLYLNDELEEEANKVQDEFTEKDVRISDLFKFLDTPVPENWYELDIWSRREFLQGTTTGNNTFIRSKITVMEIWTELFGGSIKDIDKRHSREINDMMKNTRFWEPARFGKDGHRERGFRRINSRTRPIQEFDASTLLN